jgi:hypothetical protein
MKEMRSLSELSDSEKATFIENYKIVNYITDACLKANAEKVINVTRYKLKPLGSDIKYIKYQYYTLVSSIVNFITAVFAQDSRVKLDNDLAQVCEYLKLQYAVDGFNESFLRELPGFIPMHGQDILLYRAIENEAGTENGISFFGYNDLTAGYVSLTREFYAAILDENGVQEALEKLTAKFGVAFSTKNINDNDLCFSYINAKTKQASDENFVQKFADFMNALPDFVYHPNHAASRYLGKNFDYQCSCGLVHRIDDCEAICDGGVAHFVVYRSPCKSAIVKVISKGLFRINGVEVSKILTGREGLVEIACEAVASRKRIV